ncbi:MAG: Xaa-Pro peptidase family protein, partial [Oscillospiraceae bacterium]
SACLLVHSLRAAHAAEEAAIEPIYLYGRWGDTSPLAMTPAEAIAQILGKAPLRLGIETDSISLRFFGELQSALAIRESVDLSHEIAMMKLIKDEAEISCLRKAALLVDTGIEATLAALAGGRSEAEASTEGQYAMRQMWSKRFPDSEVSGFGTAEGGMFDSLHVWCMSNERIAYGCDCPRHYTPVSGDITLPMAWAKVDGYHAENERCVMAGTVTGIRERAYHAMLEARQAVFEALRPGVAFEALFEQAAAVYTDHGFGHLLPGRIGHGLGCAAHEFPSITRGNSMLLEPGMVMSIEPGILDRAWGGVRHSDTVLVTENGYECLTRLPRGIVRITPR